MRYKEAVEFLESLQIMPKTMPGLTKTHQALIDQQLSSVMPSERVIVVAGTNGKGTTCATLESLLLSAQQNVVLFTSPHLISTVERFRYNGQSISEKDFVEVFLKCRSVIEKNQLSHFESLTLMLMEWVRTLQLNKKLDYLVLEVGLGGTFDSTNAIPHDYCVLTPIGFDHVHILGPTLKDIALNKLGIVNRFGQKVIYQSPQNELCEIYEEYFKKQKSLSYVVPQEKYSLSDNKDFILETKWGNANLNILGRRSAQNAMTALMVFEKLGYKVENHLKALSQVNWPGRMQKINWPYQNKFLSLYLSGDHNVQGIESLIEILNDLKIKEIHFILGIGVDKDESEMISRLIDLEQQGFRVKFSLTETPFKGRPVNRYSEFAQNQAFMKEPHPIFLLDQLAEKYINENSHETVIVTGSLYLVGQILKELQIRNSRI